LAKRLAGNELLEFKRIAATLYRNNKRWKQSIELSKADNLYKDAMETAAESQDREIAEDLLRFFVEPQHKVESAHCFAACLYTCYGLIRPDVALELAWRYKLLDFSFPFLIQILKDYTQKVDELYALAHPKTDGEAETGPVNSGLTFPLNPMLTNPHGGFVQGMGTMGAPILTNPPLQGGLPQGISPVIPVVGSGVIPMGSPMPGQRGGYYY